VTGTKGSVPSSSLKKTVISDINSILQIECTQLLKAIYQEFDTEIIGVGTGNITLFYGCVILHDDLPNVTLYLLLGVRLSFVLPELDCLPA
jgi:hypothetical protein